MAMVELMNRDILKGIVSQNIDGLHRRSGINPGQLSELHGNNNLEICVKCNREHMRDFNTRVDNKKHMTGRICDTPACKGALKDTIINFGESLDQEVLLKGYAIEAISDLSIAMGSSMRVSPANELPLLAKANGGKFVMCNLQKVQVAAFADLVIYERCDVIMKKVMEKLEIPIPEFRRSYRLKVALVDNGKKATFTGVDTNGACYSLFKSLKVSGLAAATASFPTRGNMIQPYS